MLDVVIRWIFVFEGLLFAALGIPMALGRVPPNRWYGFRYAKTMSRPDVWYAANRAMGIDLVIAGAVIAVAAVVFALAFRNRPVRDVALSNVAVMIVTLVAVLVRGRLCVPADEQRASGGGLGPLLQSSSE